MNPENNPFYTGWMSFDLGRFRPCDGTYCFYPYDELPPIDMALFQGNFQWLPAVEENLKAVVDIHKQVPGDALGKKLSRLVETAGQMGLTLPKSFVRFMGSTALHDQIPSCTACYFDLPEKIVKSPVGDGYIIRFLNDQQDVLLWYLYLTPDGDHCIFVSNIYFDEQLTEEITGEKALRASAYCAPDFEAFLYRYWLENTIWFALNESGGSLTKEQERYLSYYPAVPDQPSI